MSKEKQIRPFGWRDKVGYLIGMRMKYDATLNSHARTLGTTINETV